MIRYFFTSGLVWGIPIAFIAAHALLGLADLGVYR